MSTARPECRDTRGGTSPLAASAPPHPQVPRPGSRCVGPGHEWPVCIDGVPVRVRSIRPDDRERLLRFFDGLTEMSIRSRFLGCKTSLSERELAYFAEPEPDRHAAIVATADLVEGKEIVGVARYIRLEGDRPAPGPRAEVAVTVADALQGRGLGTLLFLRLTAMARSQGIVVFEADVFADNRRMLSMLRRNTRVTSWDVQAGVVRVSCGLDQAAETPPGRNVASPEIDESGFVDLSRSHLPGLKARPTRQQEMATGRMPRVGPDRDQDEPRRGQGQAG